ncbi:MAG TPA: MBL fold metallo-hydrolase [Deltaproteobacteria bacterium]|nr:MBL fold metallo-hydrolase [Deltaproteobacteria bacterium]
MSTVITTRRNTSIEILNLGDFLLDGGTMFGRVPKVMWERWFAADGLNRITMATNVMRFVKDGHTYVVEAGLGRRYPEKSWEIMGTSPERVLTVDEPVDRLVLTHLHWDHCGGVHDMEIRDRVYVSRTEWEDAHGETPLSKGSYRAEDLEVIGKRLELVDGPRQIADGVAILPTPGHTRGHISVLIDDEVLYAGDLIPTSAHVHLPCIMAYDLYPLAVLETKREILSQAVQKGWTVVFEHDPYRPVGKVAFEKGRFTAT